MLLLSTALAGILQTKTGDAEWFEAPIQRGVLMPRGWMSVELGADDKHSTAYRNARGQVVDYADGTEFVYHRLWLDIEQGFSDRVTFSLMVPWVHTTLKNDLGAELATLAMGDAVAGFTYGNLRGEAVSLHLKTPSGVEWPSGFTNSTTGFLTGTGTTDLTLTLHEHVVRGRWAAHAQAFGTWRIPGIVGYVVEKDGFGNGWMDAGDSVGGELALKRALGQRVVVHADGRAEMFQVFQTGTSGDSVFRINKEVLPRTGGLWVFAGGGVDVDLSRHWAVGYDLSWQAMGTDSRVFGGLGLEAFSPQPGITHTVSVEGRW